MTLWQLLECDSSVQMTLTQSLAMTPAASVSGLYLGHPQAEYFSIGKVTKEQVGQLGVTTEQVEQYWVTMEQVGQWGITKERVG